MLGPTATARIETPIGVIALHADDRALRSVRILPRQRGELLVGDHPVLSSAAEQLRAWFAGDRTGFDLPLAPPETAEGGSLRAGICSIPYGETMTYGALAGKTGSVARAVGQACKTNPFPIIVPCHRVTSASGPEFYSGGEGPKTKGWLLDFEAAHLPPERRTRLL